MALQSVATKKWKWSCQSKRRPVRNRCHDSYLGRVSTCFACWLSEEPKKNNTCSIMRVFSKIYLVPSQKNIRESFPKEFSSTMAMVLAQYPPLFFIFYFFHICLKCRIAEMASQSLHLLVHSPNDYKPPALG